MKTTYSRRDAIAVGALALIGTTLTGRMKAQTSDGAKTPAADPKSEPGAIKTRTASCNCGQLRVTTKGPDPDRHVQLLFVPEADGQSVLRPGAIPK